MSSESALPRSPLLLPYPQRIVGPRLDKASFLRPQNLPHPLLTYSM